jgi:hypothetical protein
MQKEIRKFVAAISTLGLLAGCSETGTIEAKKDDTSAPAQNIRPFVDHDSLARGYENRARKLLEIAAKHQKRLQYYEDKKSLYGRHGQDSKAQAIAWCKNTSWQQRELPSKLIFTARWRRDLRTVIMSLWERYINLDCARSSTVNLAGTG